MCGTTEALLSAGRRNAGRPKLRSSPEGRPAVLDAYL